MLTAVKSVPVNISPNCGDIWLVEKVRGTPEQWIKEGKNAVACTRLSCHSFAANAVRLQLRALAYNRASGW
jgi:hypothetical protein